MREKFLTKGTRSIFALVFAFGICLHFTASAQNNGIIRGRVTDKKTGSALPLVNVVVKGTAHGDASKPDGEFEIRSLPPGTYTLVVTLVGYESQQITDVAVSAGSVTTRNISMEESSVQIGDVTVYGASMRGEKITDAPAAVSVLSP
ncbi:MAG: carboxypeptidase-like regulatory domain-containing protein, partial [bacterium]